VVTAPPRLAEPARPSRTAAVEASWTPILSAGSRTTTTLYRVSPVEDLNEKKGERKMLNVWGRLKFTRNDIQDLFRDMLGCEHNQPVSFCLQQANTPNVSNVHIT
jgi:hypothetical protein